MIDKQFEQIKKTITTSQVRDFLLKLISIQSLSGQEGNILEFVTNFLVSQKIRFEKQLVSKGRYNLVLSMSNSKAKGILLNTHLDTVPNYNLKQLQPYVRNGKIYGRGACDAKGNVTAMLLAFLAISNLNITTEIPVTLALMVGEENSGDGVATFIKKYKNFRLAIIGEPTNLTVANTQSGYLEMTLVVKSAASHAFDPIGDQSILKMTEIINEIKMLQEKYFKRSNIFVKYIIGGNEDTFWYTREKCKSALLINTYPDFEIVKFREGVNNILTKINRKARHAKAFMKLEDWDNGITTRKNIWAITHLQKSCSKMKLPFTLTHLPSWTDGSTIASENIPTFIFGPGSLKTAHTKFENVRIADVRNASLLISHFLINLKNPNL